MRPKLTIIMPVYNAENHLQRSLDSVFKQTFTDFEVILVNDGSKDKTREICDRNAALDDRVKVVHKVNGGTSSARNEGLKVASGEYIGFVDSDDWLEPEMYQVMVEKAENHDVDLVISDYKRVFEDGTSFEVIQPIREGYYDKSDMIKEYFPCLLMRDDIDYPPTISNWACLFRKTLLRDNDIWYDTATKYNEDFLFGARAAYESEGMYHLKNHYGYNFYYNVESTTAVYNSDKWDINLHVYRGAKACFGNVPDYDFSHQLKTAIIFFSFNAVNEIAKSNDGFKRRYGDIKSILEHAYLREAFSSYPLPQLGFKFLIILFLHKHKLAYLLALRQYLKRLI
ncbi:glycosyltransferase [Akkermansiaceae bacterium]|nr:glycosyltransferase [Akkermansiaceae bacterium]